MICIERWGNWDEESTIAIAETKGSDFKARLRALTLAATVYHVWEERNCRIFKHMSLTWEQVLSKIEELIREATWKWSSKRTFSNWCLCKEWGLRDNILLV